MKKRAGNQLRESMAQSGQLIADNMPNLYPIEEWQAHYWTMQPDGELEPGRAILHVPLGVCKMAGQVTIGQSGVIGNVRRWGVALRGGILEDIGFDPTPFLTHDRARYANDDIEALHMVTDATHFDLPGFFIIASEEHPFLLFDPGGTLKGSYTQWYTHAGALAFIVTDGRLMTSFGLTWEKDRALYHKVMRTLQEMMDSKKTGNKV